MESGRAVGFEAAPGSRPSFPGKTLPRGLRLPLSRRVGLPLPVCLGRWREGMAFRGTRRNRLRKYFGIPRAIGGFAAAWSHPAFVSNAFSSRASPEKNPALAPRRPGLVVVFILGQPQQADRVHDRGNGGLLFAGKKISSLGAGRRGLSGLVHFKQFSGGLSRQVYKPLAQP